jgi:HSP20 family protein
MTSRARWQPIQDLGEDDPRGARDEADPELDLMRALLARALGRSGDRHPVDPGGRPAWAPALDISERSDAYLVAVELPGVEPDDLQVTFEEGLLAVQGERHFAHDSSERRFRIERDYGTFSRAILLPADVLADAIEATTIDGVLMITIPKAEDTKPRRIHVRPGRVATAASTGSRRPSSQSAEG